MHNYIHQNNVLIIFFQFIKPKRSKKISSCGYFFVVYIPKFDLSVGMDEMCIL